MQVTLELRGTSPLLQHNIRLADPSDEFAREIATLTSKRKRTEDDRLAIERLEWFGGLYVADGVGLVVPTANMRRCLMRAATVSRQGKQIQRALQFSDLHVPLVYEGPRDPGELYEHAEFRSRLLVGVGQSRVVRVRPQFKQWAVVATAHLLTEVLDFDDLERIVRLAGVAEGLGDNRGNGYGRFEGSVQEA